MADVNWPVIASLVGGGATGATVTAAVTSYRNRRQPVGFRVDVRSIFSQVAGGEHFSVTVSVSDGMSTLQYSNLFITTIELVNRGNHDFSKFQAGFTLAEGDEAILMETLVPDRHHTSLTSVAPVPRATLREIDVTLSPFNRGDTYRYDIYVVTTGDEPGILSISSPEPVVFKPMPTLVELAAAAAKGVSIGIGPLRITLSK
jgi:hypothetical protein